MSERTVRLRYRLACIWSRIIGRSVGVSVFPRRLTEEQYAINDLVLAPRFDTPAPDPDATA